MNMVRVYNLDAMNKITNEIVTVRLWAHNDAGTAGVIAPAEGQMPLFAADGGWL